MSAAPNTAGGGIHDDSSETLGTEAPIDRVPLRLIQPASATSRRPVVSAMANTLLAKRQATLICVLAEMLDADTFQHSLITLVNSLQHELRCDRVALSLAVAGKLELYALSQQAVIDISSESVRQLIDAMHEAAQQESVITWPSEQVSSSLNDAHGRLCRGKDDLQLHTVPLYCNDTLVGVLNFELNDDVAWSEMTLELFNQIAAMCAPLIDRTRLADRSVTTHLRDSCRSMLQAVLGIRYMAIKIGAFLSLSCLLLAMMIPVTDHVVAEAEVLPEERRLLTAPVNGFINSVLVRAGDTVKAEQELVRLDTRELELQSQRLDSDIAEAESEFRSAMATHDRKEMAITQAQLTRIRAEKSLIDLQISRAVVKAPTAGIIVSEDLQHAIGAPVTRGDTLVQLAPETGHQLHLLVHEADIVSISEQQTGLLALKSEPGKRIEFQVQAIRPIAEAANGQSRFRVIAKSMNEDIALRPGQTGVARVIVGDTSLLDAATRTFVDWLRQLSWEWFG